MTTDALGTRDSGRLTATLGAAEVLCLAAAPTFAVMALLTGILGEGAQAMACAAMSGGSPLGGMAGMYVLMAAFHSGAWLKLIAGLRPGARRS